MLDNYIYISRAKLAVLLPQVLENSVFRNDGEKLSVELGFDLKIISGKVEVEQQPFESSVSIVKLVDKYISKYHKLSHPASGEQWVTGTMDVKFIRIGDTKDVFALIGKYKDTVMLLVGSQVHMNFIGEPQTLNTGYSHFWIIEEELMARWLKNAENKSDEYMEIY